MALGLFAEGHGRVFLVEADGQPVVLDRAQLTRARELSE